MYYTLCSYWSNTHVLFRVQNIEKACFIVLGLTPSSNTAPSGRGCQQIAFSLKVHHEEQVVQAMSSSVPAAVAVTKKGTLVYRQQFVGQKIWFSFLRAVFREGANRGLTVILLALSCDRLQFLINLNDLKTRLQSPFEPRKGH